MTNQRAIELIQEDNPVEYNQLVEHDKTAWDLQGAQFRGYDLRKFNLYGADLTNAYLRNADLRGLDLSEAKLGGVSLKDAKISGVYFPKNISPQEIQLSITHGTRLRLS